jgi:hypothetical protein
MLIIRLHVCLQELDIVGWSCSVAQQFYEDLERMNAPHTCQSYTMQHLQQETAFALIHLPVLSELHLLCFPAASHQSMPALIALWRTARSRTCVRCCARPLRLMWYLAVVCPRVDLAARHPRRSRRLSSVHSPCHEPLCCESREHGPRG